MRTRTLATAALAALSVALLAVAALTLTGTTPAPEPLPAQVPDGLHGTWRDVASALLVGAVALDLAITGRLVITLIHRITH